MPTFTDSDIIGLGWEPSIGIFESSPIDSNILPALRVSTSLRDNEISSQVSADLLPTFSTSEELAAFYFFICAPGLIIATILATLTM